MRSSTWLSFGCIVLALIGLLWFWPLSLLALGIAALSSRYALAVGIGLVLDIAYGAPPHLQLVPLPLTLLALVLSSLGVVARRYFLPSKKELRI